MSPEARRFSGGSGGRPAVALARRLRGLLQRVSLMAAFQQLSCMAAYRNDKVCAGAPGAVEDQRWPPAPERVAGGVL